MIIEPNQGVLLVKLPASEFGNIPVPDKAYASTTYGEVLYVHHTDKTKHGYLVGRTAYWDKFKDIKIPTTDNLAFVKVEDVMGYSLPEDK